MKMSDLRKLMQAIPENSHLLDNAWRNEFLRSQGLDPNNLYQELEMDSRLIDTHRDFSQRNAQVSLHSHSFYELLYCRSCDGVEYLIGTERYRLHKGDVVMVPPGISHRPLLPEHMTEPYIRDVMWLSNEFVDQLQHWFPELLTGAEVYSAVLQPDKGSQDVIGALFDAGIREAEASKEGYELTLMSNTLALLAQLRRDWGAEPLQAEKPELLDRVLQYVEENLTKKLTLAEVAHHFFVSESTISQLFRKKMGTSFYHCVTQKRLIEAKTLISQGLPLEQVGERVGFTDYSAFYKVFKKEFGISPRQFRNRQVL